MDSKINNLEREIYILKVQNNHVVKCFQDLHLRILSLEKAAYFNKKAYDKKSYKSGHTFDHTKKKPYTIPTGVSKV